MKSDIIPNDEIIATAPRSTVKSTPTLSTITLRFVTLLAGTVVLLTWAWSR